MEEGHGGGRERAREEAFSSPLIFTIAPPMVSTDDGHMTYVLPFFTECTPENPSVIVIIFTIRKEYHYSEVSLKKLREHLIIKTYVSVTQSDITIR